MESRLVVTNRKLAPPRELEQYEYSEASWCRTCGYRIYKHRDTWYAAIIDNHGACGNGACPPYQEYVYMAPPRSHIPIDPLAKLVRENDL